MLPVIGMSASDFLKQGATAAPAGARPPPESAVASCVASAGGSHAEAARLAVARRHEATPEAPPQPTVSAQPVGSSAAAFLASKESRDDQESDPLPPEAPDEEQPQSTEKPLGSSAAAFLASSDAPTAPEKPTGSSAAAFLASSDDPQAPEQPSGSSAAAFLASSDAPQPAGSASAADFLAAGGRAEPTQEEAAAAEEAAATAEDGGGKGSALRISVEVHALRLDEATRVELLQLAAKRLWVEVSIEPRVLLPVPLRTPRVSLPTAAATGKVSELPLDLSGGTLNFPERSASARALAKALVATDPTAACVRISLYGTSPEASAEPRVLASAPLSLQQQLRRGIALRRAPLQLYASDDGRPFAALLVTIDALHALRTLVPSPLPPPAAAAGGAPQQAHGVPPLDVPDADAPHTPAVPTGIVAPPAGGAAGPKIFPEKPPAPVKMLPPADLPIRLDLTIDSFELAPTVSDDPSVSKVQLAVDIIDLSEGALMSDRVRKPPPSQKHTLAYRKLVPVYDPTYAAKCVNAAASVANTAATAAASATDESKAGKSAPVGIGKLGSGGVAPKLVSIAPAPATCFLRVRLVGMGRGGLRDLGATTVSLEDLLKSQYTNDRRLEVMLQPTEEAAGERQSSPRVGLSPRFSAAGSPGVMASPRSMRAGGSAAGTTPGSKFPCARVMLAGKVIRKPTPKAHEPPPAQHADEPQICVQVHSMRIPLRPPKKPAAGAAEGAASGGDALGPPVDFADVHSVWLTVSMAGMSVASSSDTVRVAELAAKGSAVVAGAGKAGGRGAGATGYTVAGRGGGRGGGESSGALLTWGESVAVDAVALCELFGEGSESFEELRAHLIRAAGGDVASATGGGQTPSTNPGTPVSESPAAPRPRPGSAMSLSSTTRRSAGGGTRLPEAGLTIDLMGAGRLGHTHLGTLRLTYAELLATTHGGDLIGAPLRLRSPRGVVIAEVSVSIALSHAVDLLQHTAPSVIARGMGIVSSEVGGSGAAIAIGAGESYLQLRTCHIAKAGLQPTNVWVEVDLRRPCGQLLRSASKPAGAQKIDFNLRELLYVADGSQQQRRLAETLHPSAPAHASMVTFAVYCTATAHSSLARMARPLDRKARGKRGGAEVVDLLTAPAPAPIGLDEEATAKANAKARAEAEAEAEVEALRIEEEDAAEHRRLEDALGDGSGRGRFLLGRCTTSLRRMLYEMYEPLTEPLDLLDPSGVVCGMLSVSLLARDALQRARRATMKGGAAIQFWVGGESLLLSPTLRAAPGIVALWVEAHLELKHAPPPATNHSPSKKPPAGTPTLSVASRRVRMPRGAPGGGGLAGALSMQLRGCISLPSGSAARSALARAVKRGGTDAVLSFFLFTMSSSPSAPSSERLALAVARVSVAEMFAKATTAATAGNASGVATVDGLAMTDSLPLPLSLRDDAGELLATLSADVEGLHALAALATDTSGYTESAAEVQKALGRAATRGDAADVRRCMEKGGDVRKADAWGQTALHWAASAPDVGGEAGAVDVCLRGGAFADARNNVGMTPLHWAAAWGRLPAARSLLRTGADRDALEVTRKTPAAMTYHIRADARHAGDGRTVTIARSPLEPSSSANGSGMATPGEDGVLPLGKAEAAEAAEREEKIVLLSELRGIPQLPGRREGERRPSK